MTEASPEPSTSRSHSETSNFENVPPEQKHKGDGFNWEKYLEEMGCYSSTHSPLWKHCSLMEKQVFDVLFEKGRIIFVQKMGNIRPASIILSLGLECNVEYQDVPHSDSAWVTIDQILTDPVAAKEREQEVLVQVNTPLTFVNMKDVEAHREVLDQELHTLIKPGMYFELKDPHDPQRMYIAKVVSANGGIVAYTTLENQGIIHLHDPRCHPLGWTRSHPKECEYHPGYPTNIIEEVMDQGVPRICFAMISMEPHNLEVSNLIEVLDGHSGQFSYPAHISHVISPRYAVADVYTNQQVAPEKILVTKNALGIYPQNFSQQNKIHMQTPLKMSKMGQEFSWINYKNMARIQRAVSAVENCLNAPNTQKIHCMQYVEYFCYDIGVMTHALIVKSKLDSIWLMTGLNKSAQAVHCFFGSTHIFPAGFASKYNIPFCATMDFASLLPTKPENPELSRFKLEQDFRPTPPPIFRKIQYSGRGRPERTWHFMPDWNIRGDNWLPNSYINRRCRKGNWLDLKLFASIRDEFPKGSVADVIEIIFKEFFRCTRPEYKQDVVTTFDISDPKQVMPKQMVKYRFKMEGWTVTLSACESCENFPGWIRAFLQCYGCCPNLLTLDPNSPCNIGCATASDLIISALASENGKRAQIDGAPTRKRVRTNLPKPPRFPQGYFSGVVDALPSRGQRITGTIDVPEYVHWTKQRLVAYLMEHNPSMKVLLQQLENKRARNYEILQCRDAMAICRLGFKPRDAEKLAEALEGLRMAYR